jgi:hypothetical protein
VPGGGVAVVAAGPTGVVDAAGGRVGAPAVCSAGTTASGIRSAGVASQYTAAPAPASKTKPATPAAISDLDIR